MGKRSAELKVRDFSKLEFNPGQLVHDICQVYINLGEKEGFCRAVAQDGRSYNSALFSKAERVLIKIRTPIEFYDKLKQFSSRVKVSISFTDLLCCDRFPQLLLTSE